MYLIFTSIFKLVTLCNTESFAILSTKINIYKFCEMNGNMWESRSQEYLRQNQICIQNFYHCTRSILVDLNKGRKSSVLIPLNK